MRNIRNFAIIAHIDHGKSTLSERLIELAGLMKLKKNSYLVMDDMDIEKERGITIKANSARLKYLYNNTEYILNLVDTPGHVDFSYEVVRSLHACEGVILLVDATQGVEAQTIANLYLAFDTDKTIIPVINKIDVKNVDLNNIRKQLVDLGFNEDEIIYISAKTGSGIDKLLVRIIEKIPPPEGSLELPMRALIFDAKYDSYVGGILYLRLFDGEIRKGDKIKFIHGNKIHELTEIGVLTPERKIVESLKAGEVGYCMAGMKSLEEIKIGDTIVKSDSVNLEPIKGYKDAKPMVFCGLYPVNGGDFAELKRALDKLHLNDASFKYMPESSEALGTGFRCGFLGLLHMEIIQERLEREFGLDLIMTSPNVIYKLVLKSGVEEEIENPSAFPEFSLIEKIYEPFVDIKIVTLSDYLGQIFALLTDRRGRQKEMIYIDNNRVLLEYELPLAEMIFDFFDKLKSVSRGYASMDYDNINYQISDVIKLDILVQEEKIDALSIIVHKTKAYRYGKNLVKKLKEVIPRHMFAIPIQAAIGSKIIARETMPAMRKNVTAKCYGGDITRKRKLIEKQKEGKKRMKKIGKVEIPQEGFLAVLKISDD